MNATKGTVVWAQVDPKVGKWLWSERQDLFWIAGLGSMAFALLAVPATLAVPALGVALVPVFLRLAAICNQPHYAITYQLIWRERGRARSSWFWFLASTPIFLAFTLYAAFFSPTLIGIVNRVYLTWSAYHYAKQHFGIASMYQARSKAALEPREKYAVMTGFVAIAAYVMLLLNMVDGLGATATYSASTIGDGFDTMMLPASLYPLALAAVVVGAGAFVLGESWHKKRTGQSFVREHRILFLTNFVWFVLPYIHLPGSRVPWTGEALSTWLPYAPPFFHCAQYLGVCGWRARTTGPVKIIYYFVGLVVLGYLLFEGFAWGLEHTAHVREAQALMLVMAVVNIHHFFIDGLMWKARRRPTPIAASASAPPAKPAEKAAA